MTGIGGYTIHRQDGTPVPVDWCSHCTALVISADMAGHVEWHLRLAADLRAIADSAASANAGVNSVSSALSEHTGEYA